MGPKRPDWVLKVTAEKGKRIYIQILMMQLVRYNFTVLCAKIEESLIRSSPTNEQILLLGPIGL